MEERLELAEMQTSLWSTWRARAVGGRRAGAVGGDGRAVRRQLRRGQGWAGPHLLHLGSAVFTAGRRPGLWGRHLEQVGAGGGLGSCGGFPRRLTIYLSLGGGWERSSASYRPLEAPRRPAPQLPCL